MRVLHLDSGSEMRGGQWQALRLAEGLYGSGHFVTVLARDGSPLFNKARGAGLDVRPLRAGALRRLSRAADVTHAHDARSHTLAALLSASPLVVSRRVAFPIAKAFPSRWKYAQPEHYIAVSRFVRSVLIQGGIPADKVSVVYDGVPLLDRTPPGKRVVIPNSTDPRKGTALALEAARLAGVEARLSEDLAEDLRDAALLVSISESEGLGSSLLLAMSAGVPVVASRVGGVPEIVREGQTGLLIENAPEAIASAIRRLLGDRALAERIAMEARRMVEEEFSVPTMVSGTLRVYQQVLS